MKTFTKPAAKLLNIQAWSEIMMENPASFPYLVSNLSAYCKMRSVQQFLTL